MTDRVELAMRELVSALRAELAPPREPTTMVSIAEAARLLGCSRTTIYAALDSGHLASRKLGRRRLISRAALEQYADAP